MPRKRFLFLLAAAAVLFLSVFFAWRLNFLDAPLRSGLSRLTGLDVTFSKIDYRLFNRITVDSLSVGRDFRCDRVTVYFNPLRLALNPGRPELSLVSVSVDKPWINLNDRLLNLISKASKGRGGKPGKTPDISISWSGGAVAGPYIQLSDFSGDISLDGGLKGTVSGTAAGGKFGAAADLKGTGTLLAGELTADFRSRDAEAELRARIERLAAGDIKASLSFPALRYKTCDLRDSTGTVEYSKHGINAEVRTPAGGVIVSGAGADRFAYGASADLSKLDASLSGGVFISGKNEFGVLDGSVSVKNLSVSGNRAGSAFFAFRRGKDGALGGAGSLQPSNLLFDVSMDGRYGLNARFRLDRREVGKIIGTLNPLDLKVNFANFPAGRVPFALSSRLRGSAGLTGTVTAARQELSFAAREWVVDNGAPSNWRFRMIGIGGEWAFEGGSDEKDWTLEARWKGPRDWNAAAKLDGFDLAKLSVWLPADKAVKGRLTGEASYSGGTGDGSVNAVFENLSFDGIFEGAGKLSCAFSPDVIEVKDFALHSRKGTVSGQARIGRNAKNNDARASLVFYNFPLDDTLVNGSLKLSGMTDFGEKWKFSGNLSGSEFRLYKLPPRRIRATVSLSEEQLEVKNLQWEKLFSGNFIIGLKSKVLYGKVRAKNLQIGDFVEGLAGGVDADVALTGTTGNPVIRARCSVPAARYKDQDFSLSGVVVYSDKAVKCENVSIESGKDALTLGGKVFPSLDAQGEIKALSAASAKRFAGIDTALEGTFTGSYSVSGEYKDPLVDVVFSGQNVSAGGYQLGAVNGRAAYQGDTVKVSGLLVKYSDSEFRVPDEGVINLKRSTFSVKANLRNVHAGPVDIFGNVLLNGSWAKQESGGAAVSASVDASGARLNDFLLDQAKLGLRLKDGVLTFLPQAGQDLQISGNVDLGARDTLKFQRVQISAGEGSSALTLDGQVGGKSWDFSASGKAVSASAVSEILGSPVECDGSADLNIIGSGNLDQPRLEGSLNVSGGSVSGIPFDNINLQFNARQDVLTVMRARIVSKDQYTIIANGFAPFFLTADAKKRAEKNPINLTLSIEEGTLNLLTGFSKDIKSAKGIIHSQLNVTGTMAAPVTNGYLRVSDGEIETKGYFNKLSKLNIDIVWKNNLLTINEFSGVIGEGLMKLDGFVKFDGLSPAEYGLNWRTEGKKGISISIPQLPIPSPVIKPGSILTDFSHGEPKFDIKLSGKSENPLLSGWVELDNTNFTYPSILKPSGEESILDAFWPKLSWNLELKTGKGTWFENQLVHVNANGYIRLSGKGSKPTADGRLESVNGDLNYLGAKMTVIQAVFEVVKDDCYLGGRAEAKAYGVSSTGTSPEDDTITMTIEKARLDTIINNPQSMRFTSLNNPGLSSEKAFQRLTGVDTESYSSADKDLMFRRGIVQLFTGTLATPFARSLMKKAGIDLASEVTPLENPAKAATPGTATLPELLQGTKVTAQKNITPNLRVGYSMLFDEIQNTLAEKDKLNLIHSFEFQYQFENNLFLKGQYDLLNPNSLYEPDRRITVEKRWRFGWTKDKSEEQSK